jgi:hypothetical protein
MKAYWGNGGIAQHILWPQRFIVRNTCRNTRSREFIEMTTVAHLGIEDIPRL